MQRIVVKTVRKLAILQSLTSVSVTDKFVTLVNEHLGITIDPVPSKGRGPLKGSYTLTSKGTNNQRKLKLEIQSLARKAVAKKILLREFKTPS
ncbi:hypothetical protein DPMN_086759 [Dreissena polymorpha]|uniref:Uncharacterized protein n=1 Tax=Dreissena polymorpha TaxID=45954 RepID=A0A9D4QUV7_DREPO|nr:hypothetical protein DPMN_086759 [Dreissena polymorpha]